MLFQDEVRLWALERHDLLQNYQWANDPELIQLVGMTPVPRSAASIDVWYEGIAAKADVQIFAIKTEQNQYIGNVELNAMEPRVGRAEVGIMIGSSEHRGQGYGSKALLAVCRYAFEELRLNRLYARVLEFNKPARALFEKAGFVFEGTERESHFSGGRYWDVHLLSLLAREYNEKKDKA